MFMIIKCRPRLVRGSAMCRQSEVLSQISRPSEGIALLMVSRLLASNDLQGHNNVTLMSNLAVCKKII